MDLKGFVSELKKKQLPPIDEAIAILWFRQRQEPDYSASAADLVNALKELGLTRQKSNVTSFYSCLKEHPALFQTKGTDASRDKRSLYFSIAPGQRHQLDHKYLPLLARNGDKHTTPTARTLEALAGDVPDPAVQSFLKEASACIHAGDITRCDSLGLVCGDRPDAESR